MMDERIEQGIKDKVRSIAFFENCGHKEKPPEFDFKARCVESWPKVEKLFTNSTWEAVTLEFRNNLTEALHQNAPGLYKRWNIYAKDGREFLKEFVELNVKEFQSREGLDPCFIDCVKWDLLNSMIFCQYAESISGLPTFYKNVFAVYEAGRFPCGWDGDLEDGVLLFF